MRLTPAVSAKQTVEQIIKFRGLNKTLTVADGEFAGMQNMTGDNYPVLSPREKRTLCHTFTKCNGVYGMDELIWVDGTTVYYNGSAVEGSVEDSRKTFCGIGARVLIFPDKKVLDISDKLSPVLKSMEATFSTVGASTFSLCDIDGTAYTYETNTTAPENPVNGKYWMDTSGESPSLKRYSESTEEWTVILTTYVRIASTGIGALFLQYDGVSITGAEEQFNTDHILVGAGSDHVIVTGIIETNYVREFEEGAITIRRECPNMDYLIECNNRVWGCAAGGHEIYACRLGDPFNWRAYEAVSTASYAVTVGTVGYFTGAANYEGYPVFFKENSIHKIYGSLPENFALIVTNAPGVQYGCAASIAQAAGKLLYKGVGGVMVYDGGRPVDVAYALGREVYKNAVAGAVESKYYIAMEDAQGAHHLLVFDLESGKWHREDDAQVDIFAQCLTDVFFVAENQLWAITEYEKAQAFEGTEETAFPWYAETGDMLGLMPDKKYVTRLQVSMAIDADASVEVYIQYDLSGTWIKVVELETVQIRKTLTANFVPKRCEHFRLKLAGTGAVKIYGITMTIMKGSDV